MTDTIITVQGEYEVRHAAERGRVRLQIGYDGEDREKVLALTTERHSSLTAALSDQCSAPNGAVIAWSSDQVRVWGERPWTPEGRQLTPVHRAQVGVEATFADLSALSEWVGTVSLLDGVTVDGVDWSLTEARRQSLTQEARRRAVENAVAKATVYATSLGLAAVRPLALSDPGMLGDGPQAGRDDGLAARTMAAGQGGATLALKPEEIAIAVQVHARFAAS